jgi:hypothetical protein
VRRSARGSRRQPHNPTSNGDGPIRNCVSAMDQGAFKGFGESSDGDPTDDLNDLRPNQQLSCPSCEATNFPNLSKLKSVLVTATCGYYLVNTEAASIETHTISLTNALHWAASNASLNDRILNGIPRANMEIQRIPISFTTAP